MTARAGILNLVTASSPDELPQLIGDLEAAKAVAWARLVTPRTELVPSVPNDQEELLTPADAAQLIGGVSAKWLLRRTKGLRCRRDLGRKTVRFEKGGLLRWIGTKTP